MSRYDPASQPWAPMPLEPEDVEREAWGLEYAEPPAGRSPLPPTQPPTPEDIERWEENLGGPVARSYRDMLPTVSDEMYGRSLRGSERYTRDEVCRGYRRL